MLLSLEDELAVLDLRYADLLQSVHSLTASDEDDLQVHLFCLLIPRTNQGSNPLPPTPSFCVCSTLHTPPPPSPLLAPFALSSPADVFPAFISYSTLQTPLPQGQGGHAPCIMPFSLMGKALCPPVQHWQNEQGRYSWTAKASNCFPSHAANSGEERCQLRFSVRASSRCPAIRSVRTHAGDKCMPLS